MNILEKYKRRIAVCFHACRDAISAFLGDDFTSLLQVCNDDMRAILDEARRDEDFSLVGYIELCLYCEVCADFLAFFAGVKSCQ